MFVGHIGAGLSGNIYNKGNDEGVFTQLPSPPAAVEIDVLPLLRETSDELEAADMTEEWLKPNRRFIFLRMIPSLLLMAAGAGLALWTTGWLRLFGCVVVAIAFVPLSKLIRQTSQPRLSYRPDELVVSVNADEISVPISFVECFFLGQLTTSLPPFHLQQRRVAAVVVRLAESADDWKNRDINPAIGKWKDGYIILNGIWCEPLDLAVVNRLNHRLREVQRKTCDETRSI